MEDSEAYPTMQCELAFKAFKYKKKAQNYKLCGSFEVLYTIKNIGIDGYLMNL